MKKTAIVCAWRNPEPDLTATLEDAARSHGKGHQVYSVEDKTGTGPGHNRNRGIEAAADCDVVIIIDAHMRFQGAALRAMANHVRKHGGLICAATHHNETCSFDNPKAAYWGARIVWRARDSAGAPTPYAPLTAKWAKGRTGPGEVSCIMGACYAFRRDWYVKAGRPLAMLRAWGCDEEALSIAAWITGEKVSVVDQHVAHLYRAAQPWALTGDEIKRVHANRLAMINAFVTPVSERQELTAWLRRSCPQLDASCLPAAEVERVRLAMLAAPRLYTDWRKIVCEPPCDDNVAQAWPPGYSDPRNGKPQDRIPNPVGIDKGVECLHCRSLRLDHKQTHTYPNGGRRYLCAMCGNPFIVNPLYSATW